VRTNGEDPNALVLDVRVRGIQDLYGVAFDLTFPPSLSYQDATEGAFLATGGAATSLQIASSPGRLVVGHTRLGAVGGVAGGEGTLLTLRFSAVAAGSGAMNFSQQNAYSSFGTPLYTVGWVGGSVTVAR
jgi:hypothetical protein